MITNEGLLIATTLILFAFGHPIYGIIALFLALIAERCEGEKK